MLTPAQQKVVRALRDGPLQAQAVATLLRIDTSAAYRHLETLLARGLLEAHEEAAGPGRPKKMYKLSAAGWETFPRDYALLLSALMRRVAAADGRAALLAHMDAIAQELGGPLATEQDIDKRLRRLLTLYNDLGFDAELKRDGKDVLLVQRNCPFLKTARNDPEALCQCLDEGILRAALPEALVSLRQTLARGDGLCRHEVRLKTAPAKARTKRS